MIIRLLSAVSAIAAGMWIAGYLAIVLPIISGRMAPGTQNGNFTYWADFGWALLLLLLLLAFAQVYLLLQRRRLLLSAIQIVLLLTIAVFQYLGHRDTFAVAHYFEQRNSTHDNTHHYKEFDKKLAAAHTSSERNVGTVLLLLLGHIGLQLTLISLNTTARDDSDG